MSNKTLIIWKHLQKYLTCQPYFIWNDFIPNEKFSLDKEENPDLFWSLNTSEEEDINYVEVHKTGLNIVQSSFNSWIVQKYKEENLNLSIIKEKDLTLRIKKTKEAMKDKKIEAILYPIFEYNDAISKPTLFDKKNNKISNLNINTSTKRKDYIRGYFDLEIIKKNNYKVEDYSIFTIEIKDFKKNDLITFDETIYANVSNSKPQAKSKTIPALKVAALGNPEKLKQTIFEKLESRLITTSKKQDLIFFGIDSYINNIKLAKNILRDKISEKDNTPWGCNKFFNEIIQEDFPKILPLSGTLFNKLKILELKDNLQNLEEFYENNEITKLIKNKKDKIDYEELENIIKQLDNKKVVWYDFEGFSLPIPIMPYTLPYQQLIFQVSVIKTKKNKITNVENIIIDPKGICYDDFFKIIDAIYEEDTDAYVVYNKTYENSKLTNMSEIFYKHGLERIDKSFFEKIQKYELKIKEIIDKTIDLLDLFKVNSLNGPLPPILLWELYGFSSIKKIEKYITKSGLKLEVMIKPYSNLVVQNGLMAMSKAINRNLGGIGDEEWETSSSELKEYCENDVRAMLMVYHFAKEILKNKNLELMK